MKEYLFFSKNDRRNIVLLSIIIVVLSAFRIVYANYKTNKDYEKYSQMVSNSSQNVEVSVQQKKAETFPQAKDNQKVELAANQQTTQTKKEVKPVKQKVEPVIVNLNAADSAGLLPLSGIGPVFAGRIIKYRDRLGGFFYKEQLLEVKYFTQEMLDKIQDNIVIDTSLIQKLPINKLEFKEILRHPYVDYEMTVVIVNERKKMHYTSIKDFSQRAQVGDTLLLKYVDCRF